MDEVSWIDLPRKSVQVRCLILGGRKGGLCMGRKTYKTEQIINKPQEAEVLHGGSK